MPEWFLDCKNCRERSTHSEVDTASSVNYFLPLKPEFSLEGNEFECPDCGRKASYQRADLRYQGSLRDSLL